MTEKNIAVLGSTGSIGTQALDVVRNVGGRVTLLTANSSEELLEKQCREFKPKQCWISEDKYLSLKVRLADTDTEVCSGNDMLEELSYTCEADILLNSLVGIRGLTPTLAAINSKKTIALANKETLVTGGSIVMKSAKDNGVRIIPVDSEHSAIFQCLDSINPIKRIFLTASGGPFFGKTRTELENITKVQALKHPNWSMGAKITIDSSTMMNKGLELIEAVWLFDVSPEQIKVIIHRESVIHSMVEYCDNAVIAQLGSPDMRTCIQYAFTYPQRISSQVAALDFAKLGSISFFEPDNITFPLLELARGAIKKGGNIPAAMNGANEAAVALFLEDKIRYTDIFDSVQRVTEDTELIKTPTVDDILSTDKMARQKVKEYLNRQ